MNLMTVEEVAERLGVSTVRVYQYINLGLLEATKFGRQWAIDPDVLEAFERPRRGRPPKDKGKKGGGK